MNIELLRTFLAVAEHGSVTRAAAVLGYSQPTVSQHVLRLEGWLRQPLFVRGARMQLTETGHHVLPIARIVVVAYAEIADTGPAPRPAGTGHRDPGRTR